jgi:hypothetical protein
MSEPISRPVQLAGATLTRHNHVCAFFHGHDEAYEVLLPFIRQGLRHGEKTVQITDARDRDRHLRRLEDGGIDVREATRRGQLEVLGWDEAYLRGDRFDPDAMLDLLESTLVKAKASGFPLTRIVGHMEWALEDRPGVDRLLEYEARVNQVLPKYRDPAVCTYDLTRFGASVMLDILRTHPVAIIGGALQENPFFVPPDEFLRQLEARRARRTADG